jgi:PAS domain S-box-containing protein
LHTYISVKFPFLDSAGEPYAVCGISTDITERKKAEQALETQARVLENMVEGVLVYDEQERILFTNSALDEMFGYARGELIGQQTFVLNPHSPQTCAEIAAEIRGHFKTHGSLERQFLNRRQDGTKFISESRICRLQIDGQWCQVAVVQDVTERLRLEREILKISEREQARIGQDLHDGLCQQLVGAAFASNLLADKLRAHEPADAGDAEEISKMLDAAITEARNVARSLYPVKLEAEGLPAALEELVGSIARLFNVQCALDCPESITLADDNAAVHLYRIAQEAITNAVKHANPSRVEVALRPNCEHLVLTVRDDGDGLPQPTPAAVQGMGLHIMRYRARLIGGTIQIDSNADGGTTVTCSIPLPAKR